MKEPVFLTLAEVITIHNDQIERYGGQYGVRDMGLLQSALSQPEASFAGEWLHPSIFLMSAAYAFHLCSNHPFLDGNKRVALATALVFLELNGVSIEDSQGRIYGAMMKIAQSSLSKEKFAQILEKLAK